MSPEAVSDCCCQISFKLISASHFLLETASKSLIRCHEPVPWLALLTPHCNAGIAIGGDSFPGSTLSDHCLRYENIPQIKMIVVLGELGGVDEYSLVEALKSGKVKKPVVAWVSGTCAKLFKSEVQFGHAGAKSGGQAESAQVTGPHTHISCISGCRTLP